jgi:phosphonatase-like hydrolase
MMRLDAGSRHAPPILVAFDLGGTLVHDRGEVPAAFTATVREAGLSFDPAELPALRGASKYEVLRGLLAGSGQESRLDSVYKRFHTDLMSRLAESHPLSIPGVHRALEELRAAGMGLAVTSGFDRQIVEMVMNAVEWAELIDVRICSEDVPQGRPAPFMIFRAMERSGVMDVRQVAVVGDTVRDMEAGWNAGVAYRVAVLTGAHSRETLSAAPHTHVVPSVADLPKIWLKGDSDVEAVG